MNVTFNQLIEVIKKFNTYQLACKHTLLLDQNLKKEFINQKYRGSIKFCFIRSSASSKVQNLQNLVGQICCQFFFFTVEGKFSQFLEIGQNACNFGQCSTETKR